MDFMRVSVVRKRWAAVAVVAATVALAATGLAWHWPGAGAGAAGMLRTAGRVSGLLAALTLLGGAALSLRVPGSDRGFGGLPRLFRLHHWLGFVALLAVLAHPLLLAFAAIPESLPGASEVLFPPPADAAVWLGWLGLLAMLVFLAPSFRFFGRPPYARWKRIHLLSALAVLAGLAHVFALSAVPLWERWLFGVLGVAAMGAILWRKALGPWLGGARGSVAAVTELADRVVEISLAVPAFRAFRPGQFIYLSIDHPCMGAARNEEHPFTLSSAPDERLLRVAVKNLGDATAAMQTLPGGAPVWVDGPYGDFFERLAPERAELWIAGGIGIAPFVSRVRGLAAAQTSCDARLIYCTNDRTRAYYLAELEALATRIRGLGVVPHFLVHEGNLSADFIRRASPVVGESEAYVCGPPGLVDLVRQVLRDEGVPSELIHCEAFDFL
jgi:predicted ferric reductase